MEAPNITQPKGVECGTESETCQRVPCTPGPQQPAPSPRRNPPAPDPRRAATRPAPRCQLRHAGGPRCHRSRPPTPRGRVLASRAACLISTHHAILCYSDIHHGIPWGPWFRKHNGQLLNYVYKGPPSSDGSSFCL